MFDLNDIDKLLEWAEQEAAEGLSAKEREAMERSRLANAARLEQEMAAARAADRLRRRRRIIAWSSAAASFVAVALLAVSLLIPSKHQPDKLASQSRSEPSIQKAPAASSPDTLNIILSPDAPTASSAPAPKLAKTNKPATPAAVKSKKVSAEYSYDYDEYGEPSEEELIAANYRVVTTQEEADAIIAPAISTFEANNALNFATLSASVAELSPDNFSPI